MNIFQLCIFSSLAFDLAIGLVVLMTKAKRPANQVFLILSITLAAWLFCFAFGSMPSNETALAFWIRQTSAAAAMIPWALNLLRLSIVSKRGWREILARSVLFQVFAVGAIILCQTHWFLAGAKLPEPGQSVGVPIYGPGLKLFTFYFVASFVYLIWNYARDLRRSTGLPRTELEFILMATGFGVFCGIMLFIAPIIVGNQELGQFLPLSVLVIDGFIAYGIATRRILDVPQVFSRAAAYALLAVYLGLVYAAVWLPVDWLVRSVLQTQLPLAHLAATATVALSVAPAHGKFQQFTNRLTGATRAFNATAVLNSGLRVLSSISTIEELFAQFSSVIAAGVGADRIVILLRDDGVFKQTYPPAEAPVIVPATDPLVTILRDHRQPLSLDLLPRYTYSAALADAGRSLESFGVSVAVGVETKNNIDALMLLGPRRSGRIYAMPELDMLQVLANHLGVALENSKLYTQVQDNAIYTKNLLEHLVSGVAAAGPDRRVTVFNREAQRLTGLEWSSIVGQPVERLPAPLAQMFNDVFASSTSIREQEITLNPESRDEQIAIRAGGSLFHGSKGQLLGALLVFHDVTALKRLESQVRRSDRLASMGTLAAGMAHEIKNPLQTLKTFTQLLGERYDDPEFRGGFSDLVGSEVQRIDTIVNQLLRFARPAKPLLVPMHLHSAVENTMRFLQQRLKQHHVTLVQKWEASRDRIRGDADLLHQSIVNFVLNAVDAMPAGGTLTLSTANTAVPREGESARSTVRGELWIRLSIRDTGIGIAPGDLLHIFDPFYTTKSSGTGLGLSVSHGIITEHGGLIDVESAPGRGTAFHLLLPLHAEEKPA